MSSPNYLDTPAFWYNVNFPSDLIFKGETTRFLRVHFPNAWDETALSYYVTIIPIVQTPNEKSAYTINGINAKDLFNYHQNNKQLYNCFNVYGINDYVDVSKRDTFEAPKPFLWQQVKKGGQFAYRIDYDASTEELLKVIVLVSAYKPIGSVMQWTGNISSRPYNLEFLPTFSFLESNVGTVPWNVASMTKGVKGMNELIMNTFYGNNEDVWNNTFKIDYIETDIVGYACEKIESRKEINNFPIHDKAITLDKSSVGLIRTNPLLSGNVKITTDSNNDIWLNSIDANEQLADSRFKKYALSPNSKYTVDLHQFLDNGSTPAEILFDLKQYDDAYENIKNEYNLQYDNFYSYGVSQLKSKLYDEEFSFFAPLWINENLPEYFVIFRADHPVSKAAYNNETTSQISDELLENAKIIKTFDLRDGSKLGTYIRNIVQHPNFSSKPVYISFDKDTLSTWKGISYVDGVVSERGEFLYDVFAKDRTIKEMDEYISTGFKRNSIICQNLLNLEFLFDDDSIDEYTINRYFGFYVNELELEKFTVDKLLLTKIKEQTPNARLGIDMEEYSILPLIQQNSNGIEIPVRIDDSKIPLVTHIDDKNKVFTIKNRLDNFTRIKNAEDKTLTSANENISYRNFTLYDTSYDMGLLTGIQTLSSQSNAILLNESSAQCVLHLYDVSEDEFIFNPGEELSISWKDGSEYQKWVMIANETGLQKGDWWDFPVYDISAKTYKNTFNPHGSPAQVAKAIAGCINQFNIREFDAVAFDNKVYVITKKKFDGGNSYIFSRTFDDLSLKDNMKYYDISVGYTEAFPNTYIASSNFVGGNSGKQNRAAIDLNNANNIESDDWFQIQKGKYSSVKKHYINDSFLVSLPYLDEPIYEDGRIVRFAYIDKYNVVECNDNTAKFYVGNDNKIIAFKVFKPSFSVMSFLPLQDFDFDFYFSDYAYTPSAELLRFFEEYEVLPNESQEIPLNEFFKITQSSGQITLEGYRNDVWEVVSQRYNYDVINSTPGSDDINFITGDANGLIQELSEMPIDCLFNTYTPGIFHVDLSNVESSTQYFRRYIFAHAYDKIRIKNLGTENLKFQKFLYMKKNVIYVDLPGTPSSTVTVIDELHIDNDMQQFKGFAGLRDILSLKDEAIINNLINEEDFNRFFYGMLITEYDRLKENALKEWSTKSMVVPYVNKWVSDGTDVRDNKYRFNLSAAFGITNFSPSFDIDRDATTYTHEWFYLDEHPRSYSQDLVQNSRGYMFASLNDTPSFIGNTKTWKELLKNTDVDYFTKYFAVGYPHEEYNGEDVCKKRTERYTFAHFIEGINEVNTLFHGTNIKIKEIDDFGEIVKNSSKYDGYKFSAIMTRKVRDPFLYNKLYDIEIIDNQKFKAITFILTVYLQDHKLFDDLSYASLYASNSSIKSDCVKTYIDMNASDIDWTAFWNTKFDAKQMNMYKYGVVCDYQDTETQSALSQVNNITATQRPVLRSIKDSYNIDSPEYRKINAGSLQTGYSLSSYFGVPYSKIISFEGFANKYYALYNPSYSSSENSGGSIISHCECTSSILGAPSYPTNMYMHNMIANGNKYNATNNLISYDISAYPAGMNVIDFYNLFYDNLIEINYRYAYATNLFWANTNYNENDNVYYLNGGENYNKDIIDAISFKSIAEIINANTLTNVSYVSIDENGVESNNKFRLEFIEYTKFVKSDVITSEKDMDKPSKFKTTDVIGYDVKKTNAYEVLYRYNGYFEPKKRNVIEFYVNDNSDMGLYYNTDFILCNTRFGTSIPGFGIIKNHVFNKVNSSEILQLSNEMSYKSKYPLVNEIVIDKKDSYVMLSNWDKNYYVNNYAADKSVMIDGMNELIETKAFLGSKVMNVPKTFEFHQFNADEYSVTLQNDIAANVKQLRNISNKAAIDNGTPRIEIIFDLSKRIIRDAIEHNATYELNWISENISNTLVSNMNDAEKENFIKKYIESNILDLYTFENVKVYSKKTVKENNNIPIDLTLTEAQLLNLGYIEYKNIKIEKITDLSFKLIIFTDTKDYMFFSVGLNVNRI